MRIFIAVRFTEDMKRGIMETMEALRGQGVRGTFTRPENLHLTLAFIGETSELVKIHAAVSEVEAPPFEISLGKLGRFHDLIWLGADGGDALRSTAGSLREALKRHGVSYDEKPFKPHITLVRRANVTELPALTAPKAGMTVTRISVMKSERVGGVLTYTEV